MREVTEQDFRMPEFRDAKVEDYEIRGDGKVVRKDRWETGLRSIAHIVDKPMHGDVEIADVIEAVQRLQDQQDALAGPTLEAPLQPTATSPLTSHTAATTGRARRRRPAILPRMATCTAPTLSMGSTRAIRA